MASIDHYLDEQFARATFSREEALEALGLSAKAFIAAAAGWPGSIGWYPPSRFLLDPATGG